MAQRLAHGGGVLGPDLVYDAYLARLTVGVLVLAEIFLRHLIDVSVGSLFADLGNLTAYFEVAIWIIGIDDSKSDTRIAAHVTVLLAALSRVENHVLAIRVDPHRRSLGTAVRHKSCKRGKGALVEKIAVLLGNDSGHNTSS